MNKIITFLIFLLSVTSVDTACASRTRTTGQTRRESLQNRRIATSWARRQQLDIFTLLPHVTVNNRLQKLHVEKEAQKEIETQEEMKCTAARVQAVHEELQSHEISVHQASSRMSCGKSIMCCIFLVGLWSVANATEVAIAADKLGVINSAGTAQVSTAISPKVQQPICSKIDLQRSYADLQWGVDSRENWWREQDLLQERVRKRYEQRKSWFGWEVFSKDFRETFLKNYHSELLQEDEQLYRESLRTGHAKLIREFKEGNFTLLPWLIFHATKHKDIDPFARTKLFEYEEVPETFAMEQEREHPEKIICFGKGMLSSYWLDLFGTSIASIREDDLYDFGNKNCTYVPQYSCDDSDTDMDMDVGAIVMGAEESTPGLQSALKNLRLFRHIYHRDGQFGENKLRTQVFLCENNTLVFLGDWSSYLGDEIRKMTLQAVRDSKYVYEPSCGGMKRTGKGRAQDILIVGTQDRGLLKQARLAIAARQKEEADRKEREALLELNVKNSLWNRVMLATFSPESYDPEKFSETQVFRCDGKDIICLGNIAQISKKDFRGMLGEELPTDFRVALQKVLELMHEENCWDSELQEVLQAVYKGNCVYSWSYGWTEKREGRQRGFFRSTCCWDYERRCCEYSLCGCSQCT